jgi:hypothetical protein
MRKILVLLVALFSLGVPVLAQNATEDVTPEAGAGEAAVTVSDQLSLDGTVRVESVNIETAGFVAIHADMGGMPGPTVGIAPVAAGANQDIVVAIDVLGATPALLAVLHVDDGTPGVYEFEMRQMADAMVTTADGTPVMASFKLTAIRAFDQQIANGNAVVGSVISEMGGWLVIHADDNGAPGTVLGQTLLLPGTNPAVIVPLSGDGMTDILYPMIHVDDNEVGTYEFGTVEGADAPLRVGEEVAVTAFNVTEAPTLLTAVGTPLEAPEDVIPGLAASSQELPVGSTPADGEAPVFVVDSAVSVGAGWIDVHADAGGHPGASLGIAPVADGENTQVSVELSQMMTAMPMPIPPTLWPMLHVDDNTPGAFEWLMVPGADAPIVYNGAVVTIPVIVSGGMTESAATDEVMATEDAAAGTEEAGATPEVTPGG